MSYPVSSQENTYHICNARLRSPYLKHYPARQKSWNKTFKSVLKFVSGFYVKKTALHRRSIPKTTVTNILYRWVLNIYKIKTRIMRPVSNEQLGSVATFYAQISLNCGSTYQGQVEKKFKWTEVQWLWWSIHCITAIPFFYCRFYASTSISCIPTSTEEAYEKSQIWKSNWILSEFH